MTTTTTTTVSPSEIKRGVELIFAMADTIRGCGRVPAGHIFAPLQTGGMSLATFDKLVSWLVDNRLIRREGHELVWCGDEGKEGTP